MTGTSERCDRAIIRLEAAQREKSDAACEFLEARAACLHSHLREPTPTHDALDDASETLILSRQTYCAALDAHHCAAAMLARARRAYCLAHERFDELVLASARGEVNCEEKTEAIRC